MSLKNKLKTTKTPFLKGCAFLSGISKKIEKPIKPRKPEKK
jgi:hypothetical protein